MFIPEIIMNNTRRVNKSVFEPIGVLKGNAYYFSSPWYNEVTLFL